MTRLTGFLQNDVEVAASNVIDTFAVIDPTKILTKVKLHLLTHLRADIRRFGPLVGCSTEVFEAFNAVFRQCSILSNRQAPSRDIAMQFGKQEGFKHRVVGGWWKTSDRDWVQVRPGVKRFVVNNLEILENVGLSSMTPDEPGMSHLFSYPRFELIACLNPFRDNQVGCPRAQARPASTTQPGIMGGYKSFTSDEFHLFLPHGKQTTLPCSVFSREVIRSLWDRFMGCRTLTTICAYLASAACQP